MKIGFLLSMMDTRSALWISHHLIIRLAGLIDEAGFNEERRKAEHRGLDITIYVDSVDAERLAPQTGLIANTDDPDVLVHRRSAKPAGCDWVEYYVRLRYEGIRDAPDRLGRFLEMTKAMLVLVCGRANVTCGAVARWNEIADTIRQEVAGNPSMHFDRDEDEGTVIV